MHTRARLFAILTVLTLSTTHSAQANWQKDGSPICTEPNGQNLPDIVSDGAGGAILAWEDYRDGTPHIYVQRINHAGVIQWAAGGVAVCTDPAAQYAPRIVSDGFSGAFVVWSDHRGGFIDAYVQRVNSAGVPQWTPSGVGVRSDPDSSEALGLAFEPDLVAIVSTSDASVIVAWHEQRNGPFQGDDIYAQGISWSGARQWGDTGVALCTAGGPQLHPVIAIDGVGGAIIAWEDQRAPFNIANIYARRVTGAGLPQWFADGNAVVTAMNSQIEPKIVWAGTATGVMITWADARNNTDWDVYAQRMDVQGNIPNGWPANGVALCTAAGDQISPEIASAGGGGAGAIVTWQDARSLLDYDIYAQRVDMGGGVIWQANGVGVSKALGSQESPQIKPDGAGGAVISWLDYRNGVTRDIYAQRIAASGGWLWTFNGFPVSTAVGDKAALTIASDGAKSAIVGWADYRGGSSPDIYALRIEFRYGYWGGPEPVLKSVIDAPYDQGGKMMLEWLASQRDVLDERLISHYSIWRALHVVPGTSPSSAGVPLVSLADVTPGFSGPAVREEHTPTADYYWELVGSEQAIYRSAYAFTAPTWFDSTAASPAVHQFQIVAHANGDQYLNWPSNVMSGSSVDNLAPAAPLFLTALRVGSDVQLRWNRVRVTDLRDYSLYRATSSGVTPIPINLLATSVDTTATDANAPSSALYYIVTAYDVHNNQGGASNEASVGASTGVGGPPSISALTALDNVPNPFAATTTLRIGLPKPGDVKIDVFDVSGRMVRSENVRMPAGWREFVLDGRDSRGRALASGVYFYRVTAAGETLTRKMVIAR